MAEEFASPKSWVTKSNVNQKVLVNLLNLKQGQNMQLELNYMSDNIEEINFTN